MIALREVEAIRGDLYRHVPSGWRSAMLKYLEIAASNPKAGASIIPMVRREIVERRARICELIRSGHLG